VDVAQELQELGQLAEGAGDNLDAERALVADPLLAELMLAALASPARRTAPARPGRPSDGERDRGARVAPTRPGALDGTHVLEAALAALAAATSKELGTGVLQRGGGDRAERVPLLKHAVGRALRMHRQAAELARQGDGEVDRGRGGHSASGQKLKQLS
jgi:hypothetical protein